MRQDEIKALFDRQAANYDVQWSKTAAIRTVLTFFLGRCSVSSLTMPIFYALGWERAMRLSTLRLEIPDGRLLQWNRPGLCLISAGKELKKKVLHPVAFFTKDVFRQYRRWRGMTLQRVFWSLNSFWTCTSGESFSEKSSERLKPSGVLASSDLASNIESPEYDALLRAWVHMMSDAGISPEAVERMRNAYENDVGVLPPDKIISIIKSGGFELPVQFFQSGLIHAWLSRRAE